MIQHKKPLSRTREWAEDTVRNDAKMVELNTGYKASEEEIQLLISFYMDEISEKECEEKLNKLRKTE